MQLRNYQSESLEKIDAAYLRGLRRLLLVLPTGGGKTIVFSHLIRQWLERGKRALVLAHRDRLIQQAVEKVGREIRWEQMGVVKAEQNRVHAQCVVASVQTLAREKRLALLPQFDLVIIDEAHRSCARNYRKIIDHVLHPDSLLLGVTATPDRTDGVGLEAVYQEIVHEVQLVDLIEQGHLVNIRAKNVGLPIDFSDLKTKRNTDGIKDFDQEQLVIKMEAGNWYEKVTDAWLEFASDRRTIVFVPRVAMGYRLAEFMTEKGVRAAALDGSTPLPVQRSIVAEFERGNVQVLINCDLFVEGADIPSINCVVMAKPTKSRIVYCQAVGRGTRLSPATGKTDLLVLDVVGVTRRLDLCSAADLVGARTLKDDETVTAAKKREKKEAEEEAQRTAEQLELIKEQLQAQEVNLFDPSRKVKREFRWDIQANVRQAFLDVAGKRWEIYRDEDGLYYAGCHDLPVANWKPYDDYREARSFCEEQAREVLFAPTAKWRNTPASEKQLAILRRLHIPHDPNISKGDASAKLQTYFERKKSYASSAESLLRI
jgi:ATP-dependent helicase IRC3